MKMILLEVSLVQCRGYGLDTEALNITFSIFNATGTWNARVVKNCAFLSIAQQSLVRSRLPTKILHHQDTSDWRAPVILVFYTDHRAQFYQGMT
jgi:hypothetical protein